MELEKKLSDEIKEEDEDLEISDKEENKDEKNNNNNINKIYSKKSSRKSIETKNDENTDNNTNKENPRKDTFSSFGLKRENSTSNVNNDTNKSESESNNKNKMKEYINTNSSEKKIKKKRTLKMKDNIQLTLSQYLLEIILRNKEDINIIFKRQKYKNILEEIKKTNNYYEIYKPIQEKDPRNLNEILYENRKYLNKPLLMANVSSKEEIELEFYKHGKIFKNPIRQRFGIITNGNFYSSKEPIAKFREKEAKKKTNYILNAKEIVKEDYDKIKEMKMNWHNEVKKYRIKINFFNDKNQLTHFLIYFFEEKERDDILELIKLIQLKMTIKDPANQSLKMIENTFSKINKFYIVLKILAVKRKLKNKIKIQEFLNDDLKKDKNEFYNFMRNVKLKIKNKYIEQRKNLFNKGIQRINKYLFLKKDVLQNKNDMSEKNYTLNNIKNACNIIYKALRKPYNLSTI